MSFDSENNFLSRYSYTYDSIGNKIENSRYSTEGNLDKKINYIYDVNKNLIEEIQIAGDGSKQNYYYTYLFDKKGNWIQKISFKGKIADSFVSREIGYY